MALKIVSPSDLVDKFVLRLPDGMRERIAIEAHRNGRSMNAEIISVLDREFPQPPSLDEIFEQLDFLANMLEQGKDVDVTSREMMQALSVLKIRMDSLRKSRGLEPPLPPAKRKQKIQR